VEETESESAAVPGSNSRSSASRRGSAHHSEEPATASPPPTESTPLQAPEPDEATDSESTDKDSGIAAGEPTTREPGEKEGEKAATFVTSAAGKSRLSGSQRPRNSVLVDPLIRPEVDTAPPVAAPLRAPANAAEPISEGEPLPRNSRDPIELAKVQGQSVHAAGTLIEIPIGSSGSVPIGSKRNSKAESPHEQGSGGEAVRNRTQKNRAMDSSLDFMDFADPRARELHVLPFARLQPRLTVYEVIKTILCLFILVPLRLIGIILTLMVLLPVLMLGVAGLSSEDARLGNIGPTRRAMLNCIQPAARCILFLLGYHWLKESTYSPIFVMTEVIHYSLWANSSPSYHHLPWNSSSFGLGRRCHTADNRVESLVIRRRSRSRLLLSASVCCQGSSVSLPVSWAHRNLHRMHFRRERHKSGSISDQGTGSFKRYLAWLEETPNA
jgi:hypothetical protein